MAKGRFLLFFGVVLVISATTFAQNPVSRDFAEKPMPERPMATPPLRKIIRRLVRAKNVTYNTEEGSVKASRNGTFTLSKSKKNLDSDRNSTTFSVCQIMERTREGRRLGRRLGLAKERAGGPADFNRTMHMGYNMSEPEPKMYGGLKTWTFVMNTTLPCGARVTVSVYKFNQTGSFVNEDGEATPIKKGDAKFNIELSGFKLCNSTGCNDTTEFLDVDICVKSRDEPKPRKGSLRNALGRVKDIVMGSTSLNMEDNMYVDGVKQMMVDGYPMIVTEGSMKAIRVRFPRFNGSLFYDPIISQGDAEEAGTVFSSGPRIIVHSLLACLCAAILSSAIFSM